jgi:hypothetical protein
MGTNLTIPAAFNDADTATQHLPERVWNIRGLVKRSRQVPESASTGLSQSQAFDLRQVIPGKRAINLHLPGWKEEQRFCTQSQRTPRPDRENSFQATEAHLRQIQITIPTSVDSTDHPAGY